jgi:hypothetical protein
MFPVIHTSARDSRFIDELFTTVWRLVWAPFVERRPHRGSTNNSDRRGQLSTVRRVLTNGYPKYTSTARSWPERAFPKLIHYNKVPEGGHFAAWESPSVSFQINPSSALRYVQEPFTNTETPFALPRHR